MPIVPIAIMVFIYLAMAAAAAMIVRARGRELLGPVILMMALPGGGLFLGEIASDLFVRPEAAFIIVILTVYPIPLAVALWGLTTKSGEQIAQELGSYNGIRRRKCPFCAESVQLEAIKCKHCGSNLTQPPIPPIPPQT